MPPAATGHSDDAERANFNVATGGRAPRIRGKLVGLSPEQRIHATLGSKPRRKSRRETNWGLPREYDKELAPSRTSTTSTSTALVPEAHSQTRRSFLSRASSHLSVRFSSLKKRLSRSSPNLTPVVDVADVAPEGEDVPDTSEPIVECDDLPPTLEVKLPGALEIEEERSGGEHEARELVLLENLVETADEKKEFSEGGEMTIEMYREELMRCVEFEQVDRIRQLVSMPYICNARYPNIPVDILSENGETPAVWAARNAFGTSVACLLNLRADPLARDANPNYFADGIGVWPDEREPDTRGRTATRNPKAKAGKTVVYYLCLHGIFETTLSQLWPSARVEVLKVVAQALHEFHQQPPLMLAAVQGYVKLAALLLTHMVALPVTETAIPVPPDGSPPLLGDASQAGISDGRLLTKQPENKRIVLNDRGEALLAACSHEHWQVALVILAAGVPRSNIDVAKDKLHRTSLHLAVLGRQERLVKMLVEAGASPNVWSKLGRQPLHDAVAAGHADIAVALVESGANLHTSVGAWVPDEKFSKRVHADRDIGRNALDIAMDRQHDMVHERLVQTTDTKILSGNRMF